MTQEFNRRTVLGGLGAIATLGPIGAIASQDVGAENRSTINFSDDLENIRARVKLAGTIEDGAVHYWSAGTIFGVTPDDTKPMLGWTNLLKMTWKDLGNGSYHCRNYDVGYFTEPGSDERVEEFKNPFTGETNYPIDIKNGPFDIVLAPGQHPHQIFGDDIWFEQPKHFRFKNKLEPDQWPMSSTGEILNLLYIDGFHGKVSDLENDDIVSAPSQVSIHHVNPWYPFFLMGKQTGVNYWHGRGVKVFDMSVVSSAMLEYVEAVVPGFLENDSPWLTRTDSYLKYKLLRKPVSK